VRATLESGEVAILDGFVSPLSCRVILDELEFAFWAPSTVIRQGRDGSALSGVSAARVSETTGEEWFSHELLREIQRIETHLCHQLRLTRSHLERWQATRYRRGGRFEPHFDGGALFRREAAGDREVSLLVYLNTPKAGGRTTFPVLGLDVEPRAGTVAVWKNLAADGAADPRMKHLARPVRAGRKVILTTWSRERPIRTSTAGMEGQQWRETTHSLGRSSGAMER
jgi:prolyl 4-hydroxylase